MKWKVATVLVALALIPCVAQAQEKSKIDLASIIGIKHYSCATDELYSVAKDGGIGTKLAPRALMPMTQFVVTDARIDHSKDGLTTIFVLLKGHRDEAAWFRGILLSSGNDLRGEALAEAISLRLLPNRKWLDNNYISAIEDGWVERGMDYAAVTCGLGFPDKRSSMDAGETVLDTLQYKKNTLHIVMRNGVVASVVEFDPSLADPE